LVQLGDNVNEIGAYLEEFLLRLNVFKQDTHSHLFALAREAERLFGRVQVHARDAQLLK